MVSADDEAEESVVSEENTQLAAAQQVFVAMAARRESGPSAEVMEVNMYDLLNNSVTFICEEKPSAPHSQT